MSGLNLKIIVAVSKNWGIGNNNRLLFSLKEDMRFFRQTTEGSTVVMGANTFKSLPGPRPLKNRKNIVLSSSDLGYSGEDLIKAPDLKSLAKLLKQEKGDIYIMGGASVYRRMLPYCTHALITKVDALAPADTFFEDLDRLDNWKCIKTTDTIEDCGYKICFTVYENSAALDFTGE